MLECGANTALPELFNAVADRLLLGSQSVVASSGCYVASEDLEALSILLRDTEGVVDDCGLAKRRGSAKSRDGDKRIAV